MRTHHRYQLHLFLGMKMIILGWGEFLDIKCWKTRCCRNIMFNKWNEILKCQNQTNLLAKIPPRFHRPATPGSHTGNLHWEEIEALGAQAGAEPRTDYWGKSLAGGKYYWREERELDRPAMLSSTSWLSWTRSEVAASVTRPLWSISSLVSVSLDIVISLARSSNTSLPAGHTEGLDNVICGEVW